MKKTIGHYLIHMFETGERSGVFSPNDMQGKEPFGGKGLKRFFKKMFWLVAIMGKDFASSMKCACPLFLPTWGRVNNKNADEVKI